MGRTIELLPDGRYRTERVDAKMCKYDYDDICCCDKSKTCCGFTSFEWCMTVCPYFETEDMQEGEIGIEK